MDFGLDYKKLVEQAWEESFLWGRQKIPVDVFNLFEFKVSDKETLLEAISSGTLEGVYKNEDILLVIEDKDFVVMPEKQNLKIIECPRNIFNIILERNFGDVATFFSEYTRIFHSNNRSALLFCNSYIRYIFLFGLGGLIYIPSKYGFLDLFVNLIYFIQNIFKIIFYILGMKAVSKEKFDKEEIDINSLPIYTIIIPLHKEPGKLRKLSEAIDNLNYPKEKLDIKIVIESNDRETAKGISILDLENKYHIVRVPQGSITTKPRACNFAIQFAYGEFLVIYDAEDTPEPLQLLKAIKAFRKLGDDYVCVQARLSIEPDYDGLLSRFFRLEYDMWFGYLLPGICRLGLPVTLGGTSNHFRMKYLRDAGLWDPHNVTEDADLGIRIDLSGKKVAMLDSTTYEEGQLYLSSWISQRVRWIKGFMVTFFIYLISDKSEQKFINKVSIVIFLGFSTFSFIVAPLIIYKVLFGHYDNNYMKFAIINTLMFISFFMAFAYFICASERHNDPKNFTKQ